MNPQAQPQTSGTLESEPSGKPTNADRDYFLMMAASNYIKKLVSFTKRRSSYQNVETKRILMDIVFAADTLQQKLKRLKDQLIKQAGVTPYQIELLGRVEADYETCAMLPLTTDVDKWQEMINLIESFKGGETAVTSPEVVEALKLAPHDFNAQIRILIHQYTGNTLAKDRQEALAVSIAQTYSMDRRIRG